MRMFILVFTISVIACSGNHKADEPGKLVTSDWLQDHLYDSSLVLLYVGSKATFDSIHIPNSQYISVGGLLIDTDSLRHEFPAIPVIDSVLAQAGIQDRSVIVIYYEDERMIPAAARLFLTLEYAGLGSRTFVLNGGLSRWLEEGRSSTDRTFSRKTGKVFIPGNNGLLVDARDVDEYRKDPRYVLLDARPADIYAGYFDSIERVYRGGHIEGAVNLPFDYLLSEEDPCMFREDAGLKEEFEKAGVDEGKTIIDYCGSGIWASVNHLVATHLGYRSVFYDGSFQEWEKLGLPVIKPVPKTSDNL